MQAQNLFERASPVLYHYTTAYAALDIVKNNRFQLAISIGSPSEQKWSPPGYNYFLSLARTVTGDYHRYASNGAVMFVLDGTWFNNRYPVKPIDYWERSWLYPQSDRTRESEDRVFSREPEIPADAVTAVHILLTVRQEHRSDRVRKLMIACHQRKLPVYLYSDETAWRLLDTRKSIPPSKAKDVLKGIDPAGYTGRSKNYLEEWIELLHKKAIKELTPRADKLRYNIRYYSYQNEDNGLTTEISNARKPGNGPSYNSAIEILTYMRQHGMKTPMEFKEMIAAKWDKIADREAAEKKAKEAAKKDNTLTEDAGISIKQVNYNDPKVQKLIKTLNRRIFTGELIDTSKDAKAVWWILMMGDEIAGYCSITPRGRGGYLSRAGVFRKFRGQGLQKLMIQTRLKYAEQQGWPWVVTDTHKENFASISSLQQAGFVKYQPRTPWVRPSWARQSYFWIKRLT